MISEHILNLPKKALKLGQKNISLLSPTDSLLLGLV